MSLASRAEWEHLLSQACLVLDNTVRSTASIQLEKELKKRTSISPLLDVLQNSSNDAYRQLGAIFLAKRIRRHWTKLDDQLKAQVKGVLIARLETEQSSVVQNSLADVISKVATVTVAVGEWGELSSVLMQCADSARWEHRQTSLKVFAALLETLSHDTARPFYSTVADMYVKRMEDEDMNVRLSALKAVVSFVDILSTGDEAVSLSRQLAQFVRLFQHHITYYIENDMPSHATTALEALDTLISMQEIPAIASELTNVLSFVLSVSSNAAVSPAIRRSSLYTLEEIVKYTMDTVDESVVKGILLAVVNIMSEECSGDEEDAVYRVAPRVLDEMALTESRHHALVWQCVVQFVGAAQQSPLPAPRRAAMAALCVCAEGCGDDMKQNLGEALNVVLSGARDNTTEVSEEAFIALGQFCERLQPEILSFHEQVIPVLSEALTRPGAHSKGTVCYAVGEFSLALEKEVIPYLPLLLPQLMSLVEDHGAISAIASCAEAAGEEFAPFYPEVTNVLMTRGSQEPTEEDHLVHARVLDYLGCASLAVGKECAMPYAEQAMQLAVHRCKLETAEVRESAFTLFGKMARLLRDDFGVFVPAVVALLFTSIESSSIEGFVPDDNDEDDDDDDGGETKMTVRTSFIEEKVAACTALGEVAVKCYAHFKPYLERAINGTIQLVPYFHHTVREAAVATLSYIVKASNLIFPPVQKWKAGVPGVPSPHTQAIVDCVMPLFASIVLEDEYYSSVSAASTAISRVCKSVGPVSIGNEQVAVKVVEGIIAVIMRTTQSHKLGGLEDDEDDEEFDAYACACFCAQNIAFVLGETSKPLVEIITPKLLVYADPNIPNAYRNVAIQTAGVFTQETHQNIAPFAEELLSKSMDALSSDVESMRRCVACLCGMLSTYAFDQVKQHLPSVVGALMRQVAVETEPVVLDNIGGALARIAMRCPESCNPREVLPSLFPLLPLKEDFEPMDAILAYILASYNTCSDVIVPHFPLVLQSVCRAILDAEDDEESISDEVYAQFHAFLHVPQVAAMVPSAAAALTEEEKAVLESTYATPKRQ
eukprot:TRINITY_DN8721_c0_g1_i1.p1 TRINITY_DN8721_c0_g1~~TRINITY_DN8721_c0_g1_i1.p1  ORF type:complete len:1054 (+),score=197.83 TRINITY_DN8721_c0_g1_i1:174-3335(+)